MIAICGRMRDLLRRLFLGTCAACVLGVLPAAGGEPENAAEPAAPASRSGAQSGEGQSPEEGPTNEIRIYRDPATGKIIPPPKRVPWPAHPGQSTSHHGLKETPSPVPGGGVEVDLQGRFQSPLTATPGEEGKARIEHSAPIPESNR